MPRKDYYIYMYLDSNDIPFYIGKGSGERYRICSHRTLHNPFLASKINKIGSSNIKIDFLHRHLTEEEAFCKESFWIKKIGRRDKREGTLCNLSDGGEGQSGYIHTKYTKQKIGKSMKGKLSGMFNPMYGKTHSAKVKNEISEAMQGSNNPMFGKIHSSKTRNKISLAKKGVSLPPFSNKTRQKMSDARKLYWRLKHQKDVKKEA